MSARPVWWTKADQSEFDMVFREFWTLLHDHRARCPRCQTERRTGRPCPRPEQALDEVLEWLSRRRLLSRAQYLRRLQDREDARIAA